MRRWHEMSEYEDPGHGSWDDGNHDGHIDTVVTDDDYDGHADHLIADTNFDGRVDLAAVDADEDGQPDVVVADTNYDGTADTVHYGDPDSNPLGHGGHVDPYAA